MNFQKFMKQAQDMQTKFQEMQSRLEEEETEGASGGGMVKMVLNGKGVIKKIAIDPELMKPEEKEVLEDLLIAAFSDAKAKADNNANEQMGKLAGGLGLPPGFKLPF